MLHCSMSGSTFTKHAHLCQDGPAEVRRLREVGRQRGHENLPAQADHRSCRCRLCRRPKHMDLLQKIKLAWIQYRAFQAALAELRSYSERELGELGITRADIPRVAYAEAE